MLAKSGCFDERWGIHRFGEAACSPARTLNEVLLAAEHYYECDFPLWPQLALLNCSEPPFGIVRVFHCSAAWMRAT